MLYVERKCAFFFILSSVQQEWRITADEYIKLDINLCMIARKWDKNKFMTACGVAKIPMCVHGKSMFVFLKEHESLF